MLRIFRLACLSVLIIAALSSCLTIEDTYDLNKNGSGTMTTVIDMSEMKSLMQMAMEEQAEGAENPMSDMNFDEMKSLLVDQEGLSNVEIVENMDDFVFTVRFDFEDMAALNRGLGAMGRKQDVAPSMTQPNKRTFASTFGMGEGLPLGSLMGEEGDEESEQMDMILSQMKYKVHVNFAKPVQALYANPSARVEMDDSDKSVHLSVSFTDLVANPDVLSWTAVTK